MKLIISSEIIRIHLKNVYQLETFIILFIKKFFFKYSKYKIQSIMVYRQ